jgi:hypothetical protein
MNTSNDVYWNHVEKMLEVHWLHFKMFEIKWLMLQTVYFISMKHLNVFTVHELKIILFYFFLVQFHVKL